MQTVRNSLTARVNDYSDLERKFKKGFMSESSSLIASEISRNDNAPKVTKTATIVIAARNAEQTLQQCLIAINGSTFNRKYTAQLEVIIVDDGSTDRTWQILSETDLNLNLRAIQQRHTGQYRAINTALSVAEGDIIISCDADMILTSRTIEELMLRHEILENSLFVGFRYDVPPECRLLNTEYIAKNLESLEPKFYLDNRLSFHWIGWPENMCRDTNHLKQLNGMNKIFISDGTRIDGDYWTLPRMVYGALFSLPRTDYMSFGGYDESFSGWGFGDTLIGAKAFAAGSYIVPVYTAVGAHVAHPDRSPTKWEEADLNLHRLKAVLDKPIASLFNQAGLKGKSQRILRQRFSKASANTDSNNRPTTPTSHKRDWKELFALGDYERALSMCQTGTSPQKEFVSGIVLYHMRRFEEAIECFQESVLRDSNFCPGTTWLALSLAATNHFAKARSILLDHTRPQEDGLFQYIMLNNELAHARRGIKFYRQGFCGWATRDFEAALIHNPKSRNIKALREEALAMAGK